MKLEDLIRAAQKYDLENSPRDRNWSRVPDSQVARLLIGAKLARAEAGSPDSPG